MTKKHRRPAKRFADWFWAQPRTRIPLVATSVAMIACLGVWLVLVIILILLGRREDSIAVSDDLRLPFVVLVVATMALSMRIGRVHIRIGKWLHVFVRDLRNRERPFGEGKKARPKAVSVDAEKEPQL